MRLRLRPGIEARSAAPPGGGFEVVDRQGAVLHSLPPEDRGAGAALDRLAGGGATRQELLEAAVAAQGHAGAAAVAGLLASLAVQRVVCLRAELEGRLLACAIPATSEALQDLREGDPPAFGRLGAHCLLRRVGPAFVLESALDDVSVELAGPRALAALAPLAAGWGPTSPVTDPQSSDREATAAIFALLWRVGMLDDATAAGERADEGPIDEEEPVRGAWELPDLLLHVRSRALGRRRPYGGTHRLRGRVEPLPAVRAVPDGVRISLPRPDLETAIASDPSFAAVLEERRSSRRFGDPPISVAQLGELLFRAARVRRTVPAGDVGGSEHYDVTRRPYPGGGAAYELEIYLAVDRCDGLEAGLYHHCPQRHLLTRRAERTPAVEALLESAARTAGADRPQVLVILAARFERVFWKYSSIGYSTILKDVGVLFQTLSLVATAIGLAACPLGGGSGRRFAQASGLDPLVEGSVGELALGSSPGPAT